MARKSQSVEEVLAGFFQTATHEQCESILRFAQGIVKARFPNAYRPTKKAKGKKDQPVVALQA